MTTFQKQRTFSVKNLTITAVFTAIFCVVSPLSIPIGAVPISLSSLAIFLACAVLGGVKSTVAVTVYVLIGLTGLPVYSSFTGGIAVLLGVTGGFIIGYIPCAFITGALLTTFNDKKALYPLAFIVGTLILYCFGVGFYMLAYKVTFSVAFITCVVPFIIVDVIKIILATMLTIIIKQKLKHIK